MTQPAAIRYAELALARKFCVQPLARGHGRNGTQALFTLFKCCG
jgi:hypothetical protein